MSDFYSAESPVYLFNVAASLLVVCVVCLRLLMTPWPHRSVASIAGWILWLLAHIAIALPMLYQLQLQWERNLVPGWSVVAFKIALVILLISPWREREVMK